MYRSRRGVRRTALRGSGRPLPEAPPPRMMRQTLQVLSVSGGQMQVGGARASGCSACQVQSGCALSALKQRAGAASAQVTLPAQAGQVPGDAVEVDLPATAFLRAAALAFLLPSLALVLVVAAGSALGVPTAGLMLACLPVLALALVPLRRLEQAGGLGPAFELVRANRRDARP